MVILRTAAWGSVLLISVLLDVRECGLLLAGRGRRAGGPSPVSSKKQQQHLLPPLGALENRVPSLRINLEEGCLKFQQQSPLGTPNSELAVWQDWLLLRESPWVRLLLLLVLGIQL